MLWRLWCFAAGLPLGALAALAWEPRPRSPGSLVLGAALGGALLAALASLLARAPARGRSLAAAAGAGWAALPALGASLLALAPGPRVLAGACVLLLAAALAAAARGRLACAGSPPAFALAVLAGATAGVFAAAWGVAALGAEAPVLGERTAVLTYDLDARIVTRPLPRCRSQPARVEVLLERGAHPRLSADGGSLWFDAVAEGGRRQIHRLALETGSVACWTCGEAGNNRHPAPTPSGSAVLFDTDRFASWSAPANTELALIRAVGDAARQSSRRLTFAPGADGHPNPGPGGTSLVWSRGSGGRFDVVSASFRSGHGALMLSAPRVVASGGGAWIAPLTWSPDARALVLGSGNPFGRLRAEVLDPASGRSSEVGPDGALGVDFSADGGRFAAAAARRHGPLGILPGGWGFLLEPLARATGWGEPAREGSLLETGDTGGAPTPIELGEAASWGAPTGVALAPDGTSLILGQRRLGEAGPEERLLRVTLDCAW